jgi:hypothetical protein
VNLFFPLYSLLSSDQSAFSPGFLQRIPKATLVNCTSLHTREENDDDENSGPFFRFIFSMCTQFLFLLSLFSSLEGFPKQA